MPIAPGTRFGSYQVTDVIGSGGMGEVYRARDTELGRDVAIKVLPAAFTSDSARVARFEQEAKTLALLNHSSIAQIFGLERSGGVTALAIELVEGPTLAERIAQGPVPVEEALGIAAQIADALEAAHERGIVHRDLKPANIKIRPDGAVKVLDFGIAKALERGTPDSGDALSLKTPATTEAGILLGTAAYMSPEQARGKPIDRRADVWAFGCVLYEMLTGQPAFLSEDLTSTLARVLETPANLRALPSQVSPAVRRTLELCFEKDPRKRISDMRDVRLALAGAFAHGPVAQPTWRRVLPYAAALALGALLASGYFIGKREPAASPEPVAARPVRFVITPPATAPLAALGGLDLTISADGERIAYFARKPGTGNVELWVRELDELEARPIPESETNAGAENMNPFFSSDGRSIGMFAPGRGIVSVAIDGRPPLKLFDPPSPGFLGAAWLADNTIVFAAGMRLYRVPVNGGGTPEPITEEGQNGVLAAPVLLPGGNAVLVTMLGGSGNSVAMIDLATGELSTLVEDAARPSYVHTGHIVFLRGGTLMAVPFNASELAVTGEAVVLVQGIRRTPGGAADYALSASGTLVYVPGSEETAIASAVVWVDRFGNVIERAVPDLVAGPRDPRLSPDETRLALVTGPSGDGGLWSYDLGGRPRIPLARGDDYRSPVWNPDSRLVTFARGANGGEIFTVPADGSVVTPQVLRAGVGVPRAWSATGELILESWSSRPDIVAIPAATTGEIRTVVASENSEFDPALSADGRWLAYVSNRTGDNEIWVQAYPDGVPVRVSSNGGYEPLWSADGRELFFRQGSAMMTVAIETGDEFSFAPPEQLFTGQYVNYLSAGNRGYDVARDGRFLMFLPGSEDTATVSLSMVVVENFTEELKQLVPSGAQ